MIVREKTFNTNEEFLEAVRNIKPNKNIEYSYHSKDFDCYVWVVDYVLNCSPFPVVQIDCKDKTIFHREGSENPNYYYKVIEDGYNKLKSFISEIKERNEINEY